MVADRHRLAAYHNKHCWRAFRGTNMSALAEKMVPYHLHVSMCLSIVKHGGGVCMVKGQRLLPRLILMSYNVFCYKYVTCNETFTLQQPQSAQPQQAPHYVRRRRNCLHRLHRSRKILAPLTLTLAHWSSHVPLRLLLVACCQSIFHENLRSSFVQRRLEKFECSIDR